MAHPADCRRWAEAARESVVRTFASEHIAESHAQLYRELIALRGMKARGAADVV
jgi:sarcosine oxidase delta subunit